MTEVTIGQDIVGKVGKLIAIIKETRESYHVGDWARGITPSTPEVNEEIMLGHGTVFTEENETDGENNAIGVSPLVPRKKDWLNPHALYRCHSQTVDLMFEPDLVA